MFVAKNNGYHNNNIKHCSFFEITSIIPTLSCADSAVLFYFSCVSNTCVVHTKSIMYSFLCRSGRLHQTQKKVKVNLFKYTQGKFVSSISTKKILFLECMLLLQDLLWQQMYGMCMCDTTMTVWHRRTFFNDPAKSMCLNFSQFCFVFLTVLWLSYIFLFETCFVSSNIFFKYNVFGWMIY